MSKEQYAEDNNKTKLPRFMFTKIFLGQKEEGDSMYEYYEMNNIR